MADILTPYLPPEIKVGSGQLVSADGLLSPETDIILYAPAILPPALFDEKKGFFPVESCLYAIEAKSKLTSTGLRRACANASSVRAMPLLPTRHLYATGADDVVRSVAAPTTLPICVLFAFETDLAGKGSSELDRYRKCDPKADSDPAIQAICVVGQGYWYWANATEWQFRCATSDLEEIISFLAGTANTVPILLASKGRPPFGKYLDAGTVYSKA